MSSVAELESQLKEWHDQLETINEQLALNPNNDEFIELKTIVESGIQEYEVELAKLQPKPKQQAPPPPPPPAETPKWSVENHPAYQGTGRKPPTQQQQAEEPVQAHTYHVNEKVQARYRGKFYNARIISMFGSSKDPKFTIKFDDYPETPTMGVEGLRPLVAPAPPQQTKRKAEDEPPAPQSTHTFSAAANINEELAQARKEPSKVGDGPPKSAKVAKKLKNNKTYEKSANDWKAFNSKMSGKGKMGKKESMFRTGEGVNARVGFTGSGKPMRSDPARQKHRYEQVDNEEE